MPAKSSSPSEWAPSQRSWRTSSTRARRSRRTRTVVAAHAARSREDVVSRCWSTRHRMQRRLTVGGRPHGRVHRRMRHVDPRHTGGSRRRHGRASVQSDSLHPVPPVVARDGHVDDQNLEAGEPGGRERCHAVKATAAAGFPHCAPPQRWPRRSAGAHEDRVASTSSPAPRRDLGAHVGPGDLAHSEVPPVCHPTVHLRDGSCANGPLRTAQAAARWRHAPTVPEWWPGRNGPSRACGQPRRMPDGSHPAPPGTLGARHPPVPGANRAPHRARGTLCRAASGRRVPHARHTAPSTPVAGTASAHRGCRPPGT